MRFAYPGIWLRDDVYAIHGHYLDRHLTVPTIERLGVALVERVLGLPPRGPDPLAPPDDEPDRIDEYERVQTPVYAFLFNLAQATVGERRAGANPSARIWQMLGGGDTLGQASKLGAWRGRGPWRCRSREPAGARPGAVRPLRGAIARAGFEAMAEVVERLGIAAEHVIFGHTHRRGAPSGQTATALWNAGSWVHAPGLLGETAAVSPYWPGTLAIVEDSGPPQLHHLLDDLSREDLAADD